jgi:hypothetical protein
MNVFSGFLRNSSELGSKPKPVNLHNIHVASPCPAEWSNMVGDERVRHCSECNLNVYNLSAMTEQEVQSFLTAKRGQRICGRFYRRADGTVLTQDCPWSFKVMARKVSRIGTAVLTAILSTNFAMAKNKPKPSHLETQEIRQSESGVKIVVVDETGAVIPKATIMLKSSKGKIEAVTGPQGETNLSKLSSGKYSITVQSDAFEPFKRSIHIHKGKLLTMKVTLKTEIVVVGIVVETSGDELLPGPTAPGHPDARHPSLRL